MTDSNGKKDAKDMIIKVLLTLIGLLGGFGASQVLVVNGLSNRTSVVETKVEIQERSMQLIIGQNTKIIEQNTQLLAEFRAAQK